MRQGIAAHGEGVVKRGRPLRTIEGLALRVHRILKESGPRNLNVLRGYCKLGTKELRLYAPAAAEIVFERVVGILFLRGLVEWKSSGKHRKLAARGG